ncbi:NUDIX hydrolase [Halieaceae bacterium]|nr:NUDIX hydrolase [Halieaceae bacterium]
MMRRTVGLVAIILMQACSEVPPRCPYTGTPEYAPSAGCLAVVHGRILVVENSRGQVGPPGGSALQGESAQCAAHRETLEETGLDLLPRHKVASFDTGFKLFYCDIHANSGKIKPRSAFEISRAYWLPLEDFGDANWRFPGQGEALHRLLFGE